MKRRRKQQTQPIFPAHQQEVICSKAWQSAWYRCGTSARKADLQYAELISELTMSAKRQEYLEK
jgi:hypothetical protein